MKVLLLANIRSTHTRKWALALKKAGVEVGLFSLVPPSDKSDWYRQLDTFYFPESRAILPVRFLRSLIALRRVIREFRPDILHSHFLTNYTYLGHLSRFHPHIATAWGSDVY